MIDVWRLEKTHLFDVGWMLQADEKEVRRYLEETGLEGWRYLGEETGLEVCVMDLGYGGWVMMGVGMVRKKMQWLGIRSNEFEVVLDRKDLGFKVELAKGRHLMGYK